MANLANLTGKKFGKLTAIKRTKRKNDKKGYYWLCKCECGQYKEATVTHLRGGNTKSCGCLIGQGVRRGPAPTPSKEEMKEARKFTSWLDLQMSEKQLTNKQVADYSGLHPVTIGKIRNHSMRITERTADRIKDSISKVPSFKYPSELDGIPYEIIMDGRFRVYSNGTIYRKNTRGLIREAKQSYVSRDKKYAVVTYTENGKQTSYYVHRLVAEAFIPNPEDKPQVNHKDGNPLNNNVENLEWVTSKENVAHAYENGLIPTLENSDKKCLSCEVNPVLSSVHCRECNIQFGRLKEQLKTKLATREKYKKIDTEILANRYKRIINSRKRGATLEEVGEIEGVTRERIRQLENKVFDKHPSVYLKRKKNIQNLKKKPNLVLNIRAARSNSNYKQYEVAELLGVSINTIVNYEKYESIMTVDIALKFCEIVGLSFNNIDFVGEASGK